MEKAQPNGFSRKMMMAVALAAAASIGGLAGNTVTSAVESIAKMVFPDPDKYLEGHYKGRWTWVETVDGEPRPMETNDEVFINTVQGGELNGRGSDPQYGGYAISGHIRGKEINGTYLSNTDSLQPSAQGAFIVNVVRENPTVILEGIWHGINQKTRTPIDGKVTLTAQAP